MIQIEMQFELIECANCNMVFAVTAEYRLSLKRTYESFYCPKGHSQHYPGLSDLEKERCAAKEAKERENRAWAKVNEVRHELEVTKRQVAVQKGQRTRLLKRVTAGLCPCCNRTFSNLASHMKGQHPESLVEAGHTKRQIGGAA